MCSCLDDDRELNVEHVQWGGAIFRRASYFYSFAILAVNHALVIFSTRVQIQKQGTFRVSNGHILLEEFGTFASETRSFSQDGA
jgi:hypothetical protein